MYSQTNPHPDLKYIETKRKTVWYQCQKCKRYMHSLNHFGWVCPNCQDKEQKQDIIAVGLDY